MSDKILFLNFENWSDFKSDIISSQFLHGLAKATELEHFCSFPLQVIFWLSSQDALSMWITRSAPYSHLISIDLKTHKVKVGYSLSSVAQTTMMALANLSMSNINIFFFLKNE